MNRAIQMLIASTLIFTVAQPLRAQESKTVVSSAARSEPQRKLDLKTPDIVKLYGRASISQWLGRTHNDVEEIEVRGKRELLPQTDSEMPSAWTGVAAPVWALVHPTAAWRILAPVPSDEAQKWTERPDATATYRRLRLSEAR